MALIECRVSAEESEASVDCVLQEVGSDTSNDDNILLAKLASNSVTVTVIAMCR